jgi:hypothetical protein
MRETHDVAAKMTQFLRSAGARIPRISSGAVFLTSLLTFITVPAFAQHERGELRREVRDPSSGPMVAWVELIREANQVQLSFRTNPAGGYVVRDRPFGFYHVRVLHTGFVSAEQLLDVLCEVPLSYRVALGLASIQSHIEITDSRHMPRRHRQVLCNADIEPRRLRYPRNLPG